MNTTYKMIKSKSPLSLLDKEQITFNKLKKTLESLQKKENFRIKELDLCLEFYNHNIHKEELEVLNAIIERVKVTYTLLQTIKGFSKWELSAINNLILDDINAIYDSLYLQHVPKEIYEIHEDLTKDFRKKNFEDKINEIKKTFNEDGIDIDLSHIKSTDSDEEIAKKIFESFINSDEAKKSSFFKKRNNFFEKEIEKKRIKNKDIQTIYKQLAKIFHPDLEIDPEKKLEKEELMKKLTTAYNTGDFYTITALEMEWIYKDKNAIITSLSKLRLYNKTLKKQINEFNKKINLLFLNQNYYCIRNFFENQFTGIKTLHFSLKKIKEQKNEIKKLNSGLKSPNAKSILKSVVRKFVLYDKMKQNFDNNFF